MKYTRILLINTLAGLMACSQINPAKPLKTVDILDGWEFRESGQTDWLPATVPGTVHTDLLQNHIIEDPYYRLNELLVQWIDKADWEYRCSFLAGEEVSGYRHQELVFEGLDTYANVYLNDSLVLQADNMFRTWRVDCAGRMKTGKNELRILFKSPTREGLAGLHAFGVGLPAGNDQSERGGMGENRVSPFVRKAPYHFGWDWGPRLVTSGIWRPVKLEVWDDYRIENIRFDLISLDSLNASYQATISASSCDDRKVPLRIFADGSLLKTGVVQFKKGISESLVAFQIHNPVLWWPNGAGGQKLYAIRIELGDEAAPAEIYETNLGIRKIRLVREPDPDGKGESFCFEVNGKRLFAKGANYIPNDIFLPRVNLSDYEFIVRSAAVANMNMLRVWGGGVYEDDRFYDLCDRYGIMVWQDFMFSCSMYPGNDEFLENVRQEAVDNVVRLRNHPCMALWCGNNEIEVAWAQWEKNRGWGWKEQYDSLRREDIWKAYDTLFHHILSNVVQEYSGLDYWPSSPSAGPEKLASYETTSGDMHYWGVWHGLNPLDDFRKYRARFMSEYGFQSFPEFHSVKRYTIPEDWNIESEVMASHQRSGIGNLRIKQYMEADYIIPKDFERFLYVGQLLQAEAIKLAIQSHRSEMPYCMGSLYWQINDCWPVASWSGIDYYKRWKALHYFARQAYKPVIVVVTRDSNELTFRVISDKSENIKGALTITVMGFDGKEIMTSSNPLVVTANTSQVIFKKPLAEIIHGADPSSSVLVTGLTSGDTLIDRCLFYFVRPKEMKLQDPALTASITQEGDNYIVKLTAKHLAKNVFISAEGFDGQFTDNFFDVLPGETVSIAFPYEKNLSEFKNSLKMIHL